ncbi:MAG: retroviral-like aspartic protease family protein [Acidobacteriota bacterium]
MPGPFPYSIIPPYDCPAPVCSVQISYSNLSTNCDAIIDSGADMTCIPERIVKDMALLQIMEFEVGGANDGTPQTRPGYVIDFEFLGFTFPALIVVSIQGLTDHVLIGRDILNHHIVTLDANLGFTVL